MSHIESAKSERRSAADALRAAIMARLHLEKPTSEMALVADLRHLHGTAYQVGIPAMLREMVAAGDIRVKDGGYVRLRVNVSDWLGRIRPLARQKLSPNDLAAIKSMVAGWRRRA